MALRGPEPFLRAFIGVLLFSAHFVMLGTVLMGMRIRFGLRHSGQAHEEAKQQKR